MQLFETVVSNLGSRFTLSLLPHRGQLLLSPLGRYFDVPVDLAVGVQVGEEYRVLPFSNRYKVFPHVQQELLPSGVVFRCKDPELGVQVTVRIRSAFYPRDVIVSIAPFCYLTVEVCRLPGRRQKDESITGRVFVAARPPSGFTARKTDNGFAFAGTFRVHGTKRDVRLPAEFRDGVPGDFGIASVAPDPELGDRSVWHSFSLQDQDSVGAEFVLAGYCGADCFEAHHERYRFKYADFFTSVEEVLAYAASERGEISQKMDLFDALLQESSLPVPAQNLVALSLQTFLANTFWMTRGMRDWFSVWEGNCLYNSTVDVEYNVALFYLSVWPELLEMTLEEWTGHEQSGLYGSYLSHDMGAGMTANGQSYPHAMEVEENTNFLLMAYAYWRFTGREHFISEYYPLIQRLARFVIDADTTGNGFPNLGVANTIDDAAPAVQFSKKQTYLAVKSLCALEATAFMAERNADRDFAARCREHAALIRSTLDTEAWQGDHYAVCIERTMDDIRDAWTGQPIGSGELPGWDAYSIYTTNGLLYLLMSGYRPELDYSRMTSDVVSATRRALIEYGCTHSSADTSNLWVSQNLWRDFVAAYLGVDQLDMAARYWAFQLYENTVGRGGAFIDTYGWNTLNFYPRGVTSIGLLAAAAGLSVDRVSRRVALNPVRAPLRVPLLPLADWEAGAVPWLEVTLTDGELRARVTRKELLEGLEVTLLGKSLE
ncbi:MAG: DUF4965 domain-containing protein [Armatimonadota bacterium]|nr:DUF4965 domain-containing protein [Armatimonadota bacterium]